MSSGQKHNYLGQVQAYCNDMVGNVISPFGILSQNPLALEDSFGKHRSLVVHAIAHSLLEAVVGLTTGNRSKHCF